MLTISPDFFSNHASILQYYRVQPRKIMGARWAMILLMSARRCATPAGITATATPRSAPSKSHGSCQETVASPGIWLMSSAIAGSNALEFVHSRKRLTHMVTYGILNYFQITQKLLIHHPSIIHSVSKGSHNAIWAQFGSMNPW